MQNKNSTGKRVNIKDKNITRLKIIATLHEKETDGFNERRRRDYLINKAIEFYYSSDEIKKGLEF